MTNPITDHDAGDENDFKFKEVVGLSGVEAVVPTTEKWWDRPEMPKLTREDLSKMAKMMDETPCDCCQSEKAVDAFVEHLAAPVFNHILDNEKHKEGAD